MGAGGASGREGHLSGLGWVVVNFANDDRQLAIFSAGDGGFVFVAALYQTSKPAGNSGFDSSQVSAIRIGNPESLAYHLKLHRVSGSQLEQHLGAGKIQQRCDAGLAGFLHKCVRASVGAPRPGHTGSLVVRQLLKTLHVFLGNRVVGGDSQSGLECFFGLAIAPQLAQRFAHAVEGFKVFGEFLGNRAIDNHRLFPSTVHSESDSLLGLVFFDFFSVVESACAHCSSLR